MKESPAQNLYSLKIEAKEKVLHFYFHYFTDVFLIKAIYFNSIRTFSDTLNIRNCRRACVFHSNRPSKQSGFATRQINNPQSPFAGAFNRKLHGSLNFDSPAAYNMFQHSRSTH